ncbi:MAG: DUF4129 domain-containing protein [Dehalococcoidales bacterium]|nr:DUF4129 domain-containing protein [Dehalococcoidales bacterium]
MPVAGEGREVAARQRPFDWMAQVIYPASVILMEIFWFYPWLIWMGNLPWFSPSRPVLGIGSVIIVIGLAFFLTRLIARKDWALSLTRTIIVAAGFIISFLVLAVDYRAGHGFLGGGWFQYVGRMLGNTFRTPSPIVVAIPVLIYLWWRGIVLGQTTTYFRDLYRRFVGGIVAFIVLFILWQITAGSGRMSPPGVTAGFYVMAFFFFGLLAIAVSHIYQMRRAMAKEGTALASVRRWLPIIVLVVGGMVLLGFAVASIFSPEVFASMRRGLDAFGSFLGKILGYVLMPLFFIFEWFFRILRYLLNLLRGEQLQPESSDNMSAPLFPEVVTKELPTWATELLKWIALAVLAALVVYFLARAIARIRGRREEEEIEEIHESLFSWQNLRDDLRGLLNMVGERFRRKAAPFRLEESAGRLNIREIYRHLLWEGALSGIARRRHETATEYSQRLEKALTEEPVALQVITELYISARYGERVLPEEKVDAANSFWQRLKAALRKLREAA